MNGKRSTARFRRSIASEARPMSRSWRAVSSHAGSRSDRAVNASRQRTSTSSAGSTDRAATLREEIQCELAMGPAVRRVRVDQMPENALRLGGRLAAFASTEPLDQQSLEHQLVRLLGGDGAEVVERCAPALALASQIRDL